MYTQDRAQTWDSNVFFRNKSAMQPAVAGTVPRVAHEARTEVPLTATAALVVRGQQQYDIFCVPCHGRTGKGDGMIVQRGFTKPPSLVEGKLRNAKAEVYYNAMTSGYGAMYSFADRLAPGDRWAVIAYIRALQISQNADVASLPDQDVARLEAAK
jgi:mono/diheme cytochrome c family protein